MPRTMPPGRAYHWLNHPARERTTTPANSPAPESTQSSLRRRNTKGTNSWGRANAKVRLRAFKTNASAERELPSHARQSQRTLDSSTRERVTGIDVISVGCEQQDSASR